MEIQKTKKKKLFKNEKKFFFKRFQEGAQRCQRATRKGNYPHLFHLFLHGDV